jgi:dephospho-CoA kinase
MKKVGLTGGIGSGKTIVAKVFNELGVPVYEADKHAKRLMNESPAIKEKMQAAFGQGIYDENGLKRAELARIVFQDHEKLETLNHIVHPAVHEDFHQWCRDKEYLPYVIEEAAILFESGGHEFMDEVIMVHAPVKIRVKRVMERDKLSREEVLQRMKNQMPDEKKKKMAGITIYNDEKMLVLPQVLSINEQLIKRTVHG